ncbi:MAG: hypothetical protein ABJQ70_14245 [Roseobacter sp.]
MDYSDVLGRPVRFAAWNVEQADVDLLIELETQDRIDFDFIVDFTAPNGILEADVNILAVSQDPDIIEYMSGSLNIERDVFQVVAEGRASYIKEHHYAILDRIVRFFIFDQTDYNSVSRSCRAIYLQKIILTPSVADESNQEPLFDFTCERK